MTAKILQFAPRFETDINALATDILACLAANARGVDRDEVVRSFRNAHPDLRPADLIAAIGLGHQVLNVFERLLLRVDHDDGGAA